MSRRMGQNDNDYSKLQQKNACELHSVGDAHRQGQVAGPSSLSSSHSVDLWYALLE